MVDALGEADDSGRIVEVMYGREGSCAFRCRRVLQSIAEPLRKRRHAVKRLGLP